MNSWKKILKFFKKINFFMVLIYCILATVLAFSLWQIVSYFSEGKKVEDLNESLIESAISQVEPESWNEKSEVVSPFEGEVDTEPSPLLYPDISVDVQKLKAQYPDVVGWIYSPETKINYPVMQAKDNAYYVDKLPSGAQNSAGSLFMDFRDHADLSGFSHTIYGHNMKNNSMFGTVLDYRKEGYFEEHPYLFYFTTDGCWRLEVFAGVNTVSTSDIYTRPVTEEEMTQYLNRVMTRSVFESEVEVSSTDAIMLLSTCSGAVNQENRFVLFAKLVLISE